MEKGAIVAPKLIDLLRAAGDKEGMSHKVAVQRVREYMLLGKVADVAAEIEAIKEPEAFRYLFEAGIPSPYYPIALEGLAKLEEERGG